MDRTLAYTWLGLVVFDVLLVAVTLCRFKRKYSKEMESGPLSISEEVSNSLDPTLDVKISMMNTLKVYQ